MSHRARLMLLLSAAMVPLVLLALAFLVRDAERAESRIAESRTSLVRAAALSAASFLDGGVQTLRSIAVDLRGADAIPPQELQQGLQAFLEANPRWYGIGVHGPGGGALPGSTATLGEPNISDRAYFQQVMETGLPAVSSAIIGRISEQPTVVLAVPVTLNAGQRGVLTASVPTQELGTALLGALGADRFRAIVVDGRGQTIVHPDPALVAALAPAGGREEVARAARGETGTMVSERQGEDRLVAYAPVPGSDWVVLVSEPASVAFAPARTVLVQGAALLGLAVIGVLGIGWVMSGMLARSYRAEHEAREAAEHSRREYASLVNGLDGVVWEADADTLEFTFISPAAVPILGYPVDHWLSGGRWSDHMLDEDRELVAGDCLDKMRGGEDHSCEYRAVRADGEVIWIADIIRPVATRAGRIDRLRGIMIDVTSRRRAEEQRELLLALEQDARAKVEEALRSRDEFLSIASHELRNPVAGIKGTAQLIQRLSDRQRLTDDARATYIDTIVRTSDRLARLVEDLLDVSRLRGGQFQLRRETVDLAAVVQAAANLETLEDRPVQIEGADRPVPADVDADRVLQVLQNLLENAAKYSPPGSPINLSMSVRDEEVEIAVRDEGIGVPNDFATVLFTPFGRAANALSANIPGMGLGLYISRRLAEAHGGTLTVDSPGEGQGSTFRLVLPLTTEGAAAAEVGSGEVKGPAA